MRSLYAGLSVFLAFLPFVGSLQQSLIPLSAEALVVAQPWPYL